MATGTRICKICGAEYPYCKTWRPSDVFRWQDVACCQEHAKEYFRQVQLSRGELEEHEEAVGFEPTSELSAVSCEQIENVDGLPYDDYYDGEDEDDDEWYYPPEEEYQPQSV